MAWIRCGGGLPSISFPSVSDAICTFNSQYAGLPLKSCTSLISGYQEGSGTPSPSNPRALHPFSSGTLTGNSNTYTFTFGQNIYSGYIDWLRGVVVGTWGMVDLGSMSYYEYGSSDTVTQYYTNGLDLLAKSSANVACSIFYKSATKLDWTAFIIATGSSGRTYFRTPKDYYSDATAFKTAMNGVMLAYELISNVEIPLGGIELATLQGNNTISADTGDTTLQYMKWG